jgi:hypothetical protein
MIAISTTPLFVLTPGFNVNPQANGKVTISFDTEETMSVQPDGTVQRRPKGANGDYELATPVAGGYLFSPHWPDESLRSGKVNRCYLFIACPV